MKTIVRKAVPHVIAILSFVLISAAFYGPVISGKKLKMGDVTQWKGMSKELTDYRNANDEEALWTNSMFSGMPAFQISVADNGNIVRKLDAVYKLFLPRPIDILFKAMLGFYILLMCMRVNPVVGAAGAISFGLSSFFILYLGAGHASKMTSIGYIAPLLGGIIYAFRRNALQGAAIAAFFTCLHIGANHLQMTYYALFLIGAVGIGEVVRSVLLKQTTALPKTIVMLLIAGLIGVLPNYGVLANTAEYGEYSTRGSSELTIQTNKDQTSTVNEDGLAKEYILQYNMAPGEWFGAYLPNVKGGKTNLLVNVPEAKKVINREAQQFMGQYNILSYWGEQSGTAGAFYFGAFMFFLAICSMFFLKDTIKWPLLVSAFIAILASWKLGTVPDFFIDNVPLWNKFRDTKMMLILMMIVVPFLGSLFLNQLLNDANFRKNNMKKLAIVAGSFIVVNLVMLSSPSTFFDFLSSAEDQAFSALRESKDGKRMLGQIINGRQAIFTADGQRSLVIVIVGLIMLFVSIFKTNLAKYMAFGFGVLFLADMWSVNNRYHDPKTAFESANFNSTPFPLQTVDKAILQQEKNAIKDFNFEVERATELYEKRTPDARQNSATQLLREMEVLNQNTNYRVLNLGNPWSDARTSYYHKSLGGYHGAKLKIYEELTDFYLKDEATSLVNQLQTTGTIEGNFPMLDMLNTKYLIGNVDSAPIPYESGLGNAWFVSTLTKVADANAEMNALSGLTPKNTAVIQEKYADGLSSSYKTNGSISLSNYEPNELTYAVNTSEKAFAVFSEIYYPAGWNAYIDGTLTTYSKVNYVLRGLEVPSGTKEIVFKFEPSTYFTSRTISRASSFLLILICLGALGMGLKKELAKSKVEKV